MKIKALFLFAFISNFSIFISYGYDSLRFDGKSQFIQFNQTDQPSLDQLNLILRESGLTGNYSLKLLNKEVDFLGMVHYRYQEIFNGNPIDGAMWIVHTKGGNIISMNGILTNKISEITAYTIESKTAYSTAYQFVVNSLNDEQNSKPLNNSSSFIPELFWTSKNNDLQNFRLCYRFDIYLSEAQARKYVFVDVLTGKIFNYHERIHFTNSTGTAITVYSGSQTITTDLNAGSYRLRETGRGNGVETYNMNNGTNYGAATDFTDSDNTWNNVNTAKDQYATDAHWGTEKTYDYYFLTYGRNSVDNAGLKLKSYVHASLIGMGYGSNVNAFWDGSSMTYGDGSSTINPLTTLDITGHEISHGVTENTSGLNYSYESGALNEAFSDCMGTAIEFYGKPGTANWLIGNEIGATFRSMSNPNAYSQPDTYLGTNWATSSGDNGGVHTNSGVMNYWFYLLSQGGSGINDNGNTFSVTGQSLSKAAAITYRMNSVYLTSSSQYADARTYSIQAAIDLYGACSNEVIATTNAWYAVGVGAAFVSVTVVANFTAGSTSSCTVPFTVQFTNTSTGGGSYSWNFGDGGTSTSINPSHTYTSFGNYTVSLINNGGTCGSNTKTQNNFITLAASAAPNSSSQSSCSPTNFTFNATGNGTFNWFNAPVGGTYLGTGSSYSAFVNSTTTFYVESNTTSAPVYGGIPDNTLGTGGNFSNSSDRYLIFNCISPSTLVSVIVYATGAGNRTIELRNSSNSILQSLVANLVDGANTVNLNFTLPVANDLRLAIGGTSNLYRNNSGAVYPYNIGSSVSITNSNAGTAGYYYYFYNWKIQEPGCISNRTAVTATITPTPTSSITAGGPTTFCQGSSVVLTNSASGLSYQWKKGTANISGATNIAYTASTTGSYTCIANNSCGSATSNSINVVRNALPTATETLTGNNPFCKNSTVLLTANSGAGLAYQWVKNSTSISGATNLTYTVSAAGNYRVQVTKISTGCVKLSPSLPLTTVACRNENENIDSEFTAFPNPFNLSFTIEFSNTNPDKVELIDVAGRILETWNTTEYSSIQAGEKLPAGFYLARIWKNGEIISNLKLVKTN